MGARASRRNEFLNHGIHQLHLCQKFLELATIQLQLSEAPGVLVLHPPVLLSLAVEGLLGHLDDSVEVGESLAQSEQLIRRFDLTDDRRRCPPGANHEWVPIVGDRLGYLTHYG
jgi:hypothetical protein